MNMKKNLAFFFFLLVTMPAMIFAQTDDWDGSAEIWTQGAGTESNPYLIESAENLAWISEMVNNGVTTYEGVCFKLTTNLDMQNIAWVPIGIRSLLLRPDASVRLRLLSRRVLCRFRGLWY